MRKKIVLNLILFLVFSLFNGAFSADESKTREPVQSCNALTNSLQTFLKSNQELASDVEFSTSFFQPGISTSQNYTSLYQDHSLLIIKNTAPNLSSTKLISRIKLPKSRRSIQHHILEGDLLIIAAQTQSWSQILRYQIQNDKINNIKNLTFSAPVLTISTMNQKLLILTQTWFSRNDLAKLAKHQKAENLHTLTLNNDLLSETWTNLTPSCKDIQTQFLTGIIPSLTTLTIFDLDAIEKTPEINYYLWNISQIFFGQDYLFFAKNLDKQAINCKDCISTAEGKQTTLLQRFTLEPRLHLTENALLSGHLVSFSQKSINSPNLLQIQTSGNTKQFSLTNFDHKFTKLATNQILTRTQHDFSQLITGQNSLILANSDQTELLVLPAKPSSPHISKDPKADFLVQSSKGISLLHSQKTTEGLTLQLSPLTFSGATSEIHISKTPTSALMRNPSQRLLSFFTQENEKPTLQVYGISDQGQIKHRFSRNYSKLAQTPHFHSFSSENNLAIVAFKEYLDLFTLSSPKKTKLLKLK